MRVADGVERVNAARTAGIVCVVAAWMLAAMPVAAQDDARTGVAHPSSAPIAADSDATGDATTQAPVPQTTPPAATPARAGASSTTYGPYVPYGGSGSASTTNQSAESGGAKAFDPDANIVTPATAGLSDRHLLLHGPDGNTDEDAGIVTYVPSRPGEIHEGSLVKVTLREQLSTLTTKPGTKFTAEVTEPMTREGQVVVPAGSILEGRVTWVRGGKRIGGQAAIHLEPRMLILPDGMQYALRARVIDTNSWENTKVDSEGTIMRSENTKRNAGVMALTTGGGATAGAMIGGPAGALVGAGVGASVSTVVWLKQDRQAVLPKDLELIFSLTEPMSVTPASAAATPIKVDAGGQ